LAHGRAGFLPCLASHPFPGTIQKIAALYLMATTDDHVPRRFGMTNSTARVSSAVRRALRRLDAWTLTAFNPRYPSPRD
jgi:hypothetical protein